MPEKNEKTRFETDQPIVIMGAGLAGLSSALNIARHGQPVLVIERAAAVGGMARTITIGQHHFDFGPHRFYTRDQRVLDFIKVLLGDELQTHKRISRVRLNGKYLDYPPNVANLLRSMDPITSIKCLLDYFQASRKRNSTQQAEVDFQSWVINRFGRELYDLYFGPYTEKVWGISPEYLSAELAQRRITVPDLGDVLLRLMFSNYRDQGPYVTHFWYPGRGIGRIAERMSQEIKKCGGEVLLQHDVERIHLETNHVNGFVINDGGDRRFIPCKQILSTIPLPELIQRLDPIENTILEDAKGITYRALVFVFVILHGDRIGDDHWLYFPEKRFLFNRVSEPVSFSSSHSPPGKTSLCVEITCQPGDDLWRMPDNILQEHIVRDLKIAGLIEPDRVEGISTYRMAHGYPVYSVHYDKHLARILSFINKIDNLITFGRQGGFDYSNMSESIANGLKVSDSIVNT